MTALAAESHATPKQPDASHGRRSRVGLDVLLAGGLAILALAVRLPNLWTIPRFTDETLEVLHSLAIVRDGTRPLTNYDTYYGALYNYLVALALLLSGESPLAPRVVVLLAGAATVVVAYLLGTELGRRLPGVGPLESRLVGLLAAALLATNGPHVVVNSHVAWSNCLTPLLTGLAFWALLRWAPLTPSPGETPLTPMAYHGAPPLRGVPTAPSPSRGEGRPTQTPGDSAVPIDRQLPAGFPLSRGRERGAGDEGSPGAATRSSAIWLGLTGLLLGLALQTHPLVVALLPGVALAVLWRGWRVVRTPGPWLAVALFLVGYANVLVYNAEAGFESFRSAQRIRSEYAQDQQSSSGYGPTVGAMSLLLARILGGAADQREGAVAYLADPAVLGVGLLAAGGLLLATTRREPLPILVSASFLVILPAANPKFQTLLTSRYLMPIVPLLFSCAALALVWLALRSRLRWPGLERRALLGALVVGLLLATYPLLSLDRYYRRAFERTDTNERILRFGADIRAARLPNEPVLVDDGLGSELPDTGVTELRGLEYLLTFERVPYRLIRPSTGRLQDALDGTSSVLAILNARDAQAAASRLKLESLDPRPPSESGRMFDFRVYRVSRGSA